MEVEIIEFSLASSVGLEGPDDIDSRMVGDVLLIKFEVLCDFFSFS